MAEGKSSFTAYCDWIETFEALTDEQAGVLVKHLFRYVNDQNPEIPDQITKAVFAQMKSTLKRDLKKWEAKRDVNRENGSKGGRPKQTENNPEKPIGLNGNPNNPEKPVSVSVSVSDTESVSKNNIESRKLKFASTLKPFVSTYGKEMIREFYEYWTEPNKSGTKFKQELEQTWSVERRLKTWVKNDKNFVKPKEVKEPKYKRL